MRRQVCNLLATQTSTEPQNLFHNLVNISLEYVNKTSLTALQEAWEKLTQYSQRYPVPLKYTVLTDPDLYRIFLNANHHDQQRLLKIITGILFIKNDQIFIHCSLQALIRPSDQEVTATTQALNKQYTQTMKKTGCDILSASLGIFSLFCIMHDANKTSSHLLFAFAVWLYSQKISQIIKAAIQYLRGLHTCEAFTLPFIFGSLISSTQLCKDLSRVMNWQNVSQYLWALVSLEAVVSTMFFMRGIANDTLVIYDCYNKKQQLTNTVTMGNYFLQQNQPVLDDNATISPGLSRR
jgi:hypothetical protein